jgi:hypothetical protein
MATTVRFRFRAIKGLPFSNLATLKAAHPPRVSMVGQWVADLASFRSQITLGQRADPFRPFSVDSLQSRIDRLACPVNRHSYLGGLFASIQESIKLAFSSEVHRRDTGFILRPRGRR